MTTGKSRSHGFEMRYQHMKQEIDTVRLHLLSDVFSIEGETLTALINSKIETNLVDTIKGRIAKSHKNISDVGGDIDYVDGHSVGEAFLSDVGYYAKLMLAYTMALPDPEDRELRVSERFEKTLKYINSTSLEYLSNTIAMLPKGLNIADLENWSEGRKKDRFGFDAVNDSFKEALAAAKYPTEDGALWMEKLTALANKINDIMLTHIWVLVPCISAYANVRSELYDDAIDDLRALVKYYTVDNTGRLLRKTTPENTVQEGFKDESQRAVFVERMGRGIEKLRAFISAKASEKAKDNRDELERLGMGKEMLEMFKGMVEEIERTEDWGRRMKEAIGMALAKPEDQALLNTTLKNAAEEDSMCYVTALVSFGTPDPVKFKVLTLEGIEEMRAYLLPKTEKNIESAIESLRGRVAEAELSKITDWFERRRRENFKFERRADYIDIVLSTGDKAEIVGAIAEDIFVYLFSYVLSLEACCNAGSGRNGSALDNLLMLKNIDIDTAGLHATRFYAAPSNISNAQWN